MVGDLVGLIAGCLDAPNDDAPILVLCDWLDERGDRRGWRLRRYFKISRKAREQHAKELVRIEGFYRDYPPDHRMAAYIIDLYRQRLGDVEWRLVGWFWKYFPDEWIESGRRLHEVLRG